MSRRWRILATALATALATIGSLAVAQAAYAVDPVITMTNKGSWLCATVLGTDNGSPVVQSACNGSVQQQWARVSLGNGYELLQSVASTSTYPYEPRCLDVTDGINDNWIPLQVWGCRNTPGVNWRLVYAGIGYQRFYKLQTKVGGRCMDVPAGSLVDGEQLQIYSCTPGTGNDAQLWAVPSHG